jgi:uncharacterized protein
MRFDVAALLREPVGPVQTYPLNGEVGSSGEEDPEEKVTGYVSLLRTERGILVTAHLQVMVAGRCSRCLKAVTLPLAVDFEEEYLPTVDANTGSRSDVTADEDSFLIDDRQVLDLSEAVRQYKLAVQPIQTLCRDDCDGLCPCCGKDLSHGPCSCESQGTETSMYALARMKDSLSNTQIEEGSG